MSARFPFCPDTYKGRPALRVETGALRALFLPEDGGKLASLTAPDGFEFLCQNPAPAYARLAYDGRYIESECASWDDMFPTIDPYTPPAGRYAGMTLPDHGEVCRLPMTVEELPDGNRLVRFSYEGIFLEVLDRLGKMPLPPYIKEELQDRERYQTVYSKVNGSAAAPTAGLHFTPELLERIQQMGVKVGYVTLHVGLGTFRPVKEEEITDHAMHSEYCIIPQETADLINETKKNGGRVVCVGTTSCRTVESQAAEDGTMRACAGWTDIFIYPGYRFKVMDALITNFHLPESTLIMLVSALAGREHVLSAYKEAVEQRYRFFSFGDAMFIH